jgi:hypothetical protein
MSGVRNVSSIREVAIFTVAIAVKAVVCATNEGMFGAMNYFQLFKAPTFASNRFVQPYRDQLTSLNAQR